MDLKERGDSWNFTNGSISALMGKVSKLELGPPFPLSPRRLGTIHASVLAASAAGVEVLAARTANPEIAQLALAVCAPRLG